MNLKTKLAELLKYDDDICHEVEWRKLARQQDALIEVLLGALKTIENDGYDIFVDLDLTEQALQKAKDAGYL